MYAMLTLQLDIRPKHIALIQQELDFKTVVFSNRWSQDAKAESVDPRVRASHAACEEH